MDVTHCNLCYKDLTIAGAGCNEGTFHFTGNDIDVEICDDCMDRLTNYLPVTAKLMSEKDAYDIAARLGKQVDGDIRAMANDSEKFRHRSD